MYATPFCTHEFSEDQLNSLEWVVCPCGYHFESAKLKAYKKTTTDFEKARTKLAELVDYMRDASRSRQSAVGWGPSRATASSTYVAETPVQPRPIAPPKPARPKRATPQVSVTQWLIISASLLVLIAASVFVQANIDSFNWVEWVALEVALGGAATYGTFKSRKMSVLLSNFLALFSSSMLMSLIMTLGTQLGLGFISFDAEPAWYWSLNLLLVSAATAVMGYRTNNFGWRAASPVALAFSGLIFTFGQLGHLAFGWQLMSVSATIIGVLGVLRYLRSAKFEIDKNSADKAYEKDLHAREDAALLAFANYSSLILAAAGIAGGLVKIGALLYGPLDPISTLVLGVFWLAGSATIDLWGTALSKTGTVPGYIKTTTWTIAYVSLVAGLISGIAYLDPSLVYVRIGLGLIVSLALLTAPRYARFVKPPAVTLTATGWVGLGLGLAWLAAINELVSYGVYLFGFSVVLTASAVITKTNYQRVSAMVTRNISLIAFAIAAALNMSQRANLAQDVALEGSIALVVFLLVANADVFLGRFVADRTDTDPLDQAKWINLSTGLIGVNVLLAGYTASIWQLAVLFIALLAALSGNLSRPGAYWNVQAVGLGFTLLATSLHTADNSDYLITGTFFAVAGVAYVFGSIEKSQTKLFVGLALANVANGIAILRANSVDPLFHFNYLYVSVPLIFAANAVVMARRTSINRDVLADFTGVFLILNIVVAPVLTFGWIASGDLLALWTFLIGAAVTALILELGHFGTLKLRPREINWLRLVTLAQLGVGYAVATIARAPEQQLPLIVVTGLAYLFGIRILLQSKKLAWAAAPYLGALGLAMTLRAWLETQFKLGWIEFFTVPAAVLAILVGLAISRIAKDTSRVVTLDVPFGLILVPTVINAAILNDSAADLRMIVAGLAGLVYATWRANSGKSATWAVGTYATSTVLSLGLGNVVGSAVPSFAGPENYSVILAVLFVANTMTIKKHFAKVTGWLLPDLPVAVAVLPTLFYAVSEDLSTNPAIARLLVAGIALGAYGYYRALSTKQRLWTIAGFAGISLAAVMAVQEVLVLTTTRLIGPEAYSLAGLVSVFVGIGVLKRLGALEGTLITWGLPLTVAIGPSALYTYQNLTDHLDAVSLIRLIAVLGLSAAGVILGSLRGNLGAATAGTIGLSLSLVPNLWFRVDEQTAAETRGLLVAAVLFVILSTTRRLDLVKGNSLLFVGLPITVALAPAVFRTVGALGSNEFATIDWIRFGVVLAASLTLLIVGAMRSLGGMFYPGFAGVLIAALPYGFKPVHGAAWLLWVILLLVAATLIWLAMRIEKMRKQGKTPSAWLKELR